MSEVATIKGEQILDSITTPTVELLVELLFRKPPLRANPFERSSFVLSLARSFARSLNRLFVCLCQWITS